MGFFDAPFSGTDWNGDGVIDRWDDAIDLSVMMQINDDAAREERISRIVHAITRQNESCSIGNEEFEALCRQEGLRMQDFEQSDIDEIQRRLDRW